MLIKRFSVSPKGVIAVLSLSVIVGVVAITSVRAATTSASCIITLFGQQYNVTALQTAHTGGNIFVCGTDMSASYQAMHGTNITRMAPYLITASTTPSATPTPTVTPTPTPSATPSPSASPTASPSTSPSPTPSASVTPSASPSVGFDDDDELEEHEEDENEDESEDEDGDRETERPRTQTSDGRGDRTREWVRYQIKYRYFLQSRDRNDD